MSVRTVRSILVAAPLLLGACNDDGGGSDDGGTGEGTGDGTGGTGDDGEPDEPELPPIDPEICNNLTFDNVIDEASCPEIQGRGIEPEPADDFEMCRRYTLDLLGYSPTVDDYEADCKGRTREEIVDDFMGRDGYVQLGRRVWADEFLMTSQETYYEYVAQLDALVQQLYRGEIKLGELARQIVTHPGFTGRFEGQDLPGYSFLAFLGRDAAPHERKGLEPLWHMWQDRFIDEHPLYYFGYSKMVVNTILCMGGNEADCHSDLWGHHSVVIPPIEEDNYDYDGVNVLDLADLSPDQWQELAKPGDLITQQPVFHETAANKSLVRYLGYRAGVQIPRVAQVLVDLLDATNGDVRRIEREILTSQLYWMASAFPDPEETPEELSSPDFWHGPMKQMTAEMWLDSVANLSGMDLGHCDPRFPDVQGGRPEGAPYEDNKWHPNEYPKDLDGWPAEANKPDYRYRDMARLLGGCPDQLAQLRFTGTGVMIALAQSNITQEICAEVTVEAPIVPGNLDPTDKSVAHLTEIADHMYGAALLTEVPEGLQDALDGSVEGCRDDAECDAGMFAFHICSAVLKSGPFLFY